MCLSRSHGSRLGGFGDNRPIPSSSFSLFGFNLVNSWIAMSTLCELINENKRRNMYGTSVNTTCTFFFNVGFLCVV
jgi:hypothetical protein